MVPCLLHNNAPGCACTVKFAVKRSQHISHSLKPLNKCFQKVWFVDIVFKKCGLLILQYLWNIEQAAKEKLIAFQKVFFFYMELALTICMIMRKATYRISKIMEFYQP